MSRKTGKFYFTCVCKNAHPVSFNNKFTFNSVSDQKERSFGNVLVVSHLNIIANKTLLIFRVSCFSYGFLYFPKPAVFKPFISMHALKGILNLPTSSLHLCSPFQQNC